MLFGPRNRNSSGGYIIWVRVHYYGKCIITWEGLAACLEFRSKSRAQFRRGIFLHYSFFPAVTLLTSGFACPAKPTPKCPTANNATPFFYDFIIHGSMLLYCNILYLILFFYIALHYYIILYYILYHLQLFLCVFFSKSQGPLNSRSKHGQPLIIFLSPGLHMSMYNPRIIDCTLFESIVKYCVLSVFFVPTEFIFIHNAFHSVVYFNFLLSSTFSQQIFSGNGSGLRICI